MITRGQLELAAKAAGIELYWHYEEGKEPIPFDDLIEWSPFTDRGQLHDLAMACGIVINPRENYISFQPFSYAVDTRVSVNCQDFPALAKVVILAAAEQQLAKEKR